MTTSKTTSFILPLIVLGIVSCGKECDYVNPGRIVNGVLSVDDLKWSMQMPSKVKEIDTLEYLRVANLGLAHLGNHSFNECSQNVARWRIDKNQSNSFVFDLILGTNNGKNFSIISSTRSVYKSMANQYNALYTDSLSRLMISGVRFALLKSVFIKQNDTLYNSIYEAIYMNRLIVVQISARTQEDMNQWCNYFEKSNFRNDPKEVVSTY